MDYLNTGKFLGHESFLRADRPMSFIILQEFENAIKRKAKP
jgi:hypothetical protein